MVKRGKRPVDQWREKFNRLIAEGRMEEALEMLNDNYYRTARRIAKSRIGKGNYDVGVEILRGVTQIHSVDKDAWWCLADGYFRLRNYAEALNCFNQTTQVDPELENADFSDQLQNPEFRAYLQARQFRFKFSIYRIMGVYEWDQCNETFYENFPAKERAILENILVDEVLPNQPLADFIRTVHLYKRLLLRLWRHSRDYQRAAFLDNTLPEEWDIIRDCLPSQEIQENLSPHSDFLADDGGFGNQEA